MEWYYEDNGQQAGPVSEEEFQNLVNTGTIQASTLVWNSSMADWEEYGKVGGEATTQKTPGVPLKKCAECGNTFPEQEMINYENSMICATCKPVFIQKIKEGVIVGADMDYAGFWIRFGAKIIDTLIVYGIQMIIFLPIIFFAMPSMTKSGDQPFEMTSFFILQIVQFIVPITYTTWFVGKFGATPGKMACKIKIVMSDGNQVSYLRAFGRFFAEIISGLTLAVGYIIAAFDGQKRTLHDHICNTRVVRK